MYGRREIGTARTRHLRNAVLSGKCSCPPGPPILSGSLRDTVAPLRVWTKLGIQEARYGAAMAVLVAGSIVTSRRDAIMVLEQSIGRRTGVWVCFDQGLRQPKIN